MISDPAIAKEPIRGLVLTVISLIILQEGLLTALASFTNLEVIRVYPEAFGVGYDFHEYYIAAQIFFDGNNPYVNPRLVTPPLSVFVGLPLSWLGFKGAVTAFFIFNIAAIILTTAILCRVFNTLRFLPLLVIIVLLFYPLHFLLERGNIDALVVLALALLCLAIDRPLIGGAALGVAISLKLYPALLLLPLLLQRRYGLTAFGLVVVAALAIIMPELWTDYIGRGLDRFSRFKHSELALNGSVFVTFYDAVKFALDSIPLSDESMSWNKTLASRIAIILGGFYYIYHLLHCIRFDILRRRNSSANHRDSGPENDIADVLLYVPFMVTVPLVVYHYTYVGLILLFPLFILIFQSGKSFAWSGVGWLATGLLLTFVQPGLWNSLSTWSLFSALPGIGMMVLMRWAMVFKKHELTASRNRLDQAFSSDRQAVTR